MACKRVGVVLSAPGGSSADAVVAGEPGGDTGYILVAALEITGKSGDRSATPPPVPARYDRVPTAHGGLTGAHPRQRLRRHHDGSA
jgi:hypothetical protein